MHKCSQFTDKLDGMLNSLESTKDHLTNAEPISGHPEKNKEKIDDNNAIIDDLDKKEVAYQAVIKAADDITQKAHNKSDPTIKDIKKKLVKLTRLWKELQGLAEEILLRMLWLWLRNSGMNCNRLCPSLRNSRSSLIPRSHL